MSETVEFLRRHEGHPVGSRAEVSAERAASLHRSGAARLAPDVAAAGDAPGAPNGAGGPLPRRTGALRRYATKICGDRGA